MLDLITVSTGDNSPRTQWSSFVKLYVFFSGSSTSYYVAHLLSPYQAASKEPYLKRFTNDWATEEFARLYLKNRRNYYRKHGYDM
jgi:hypothetical protein